MDSGFGSWLAFLFRYVYEFLYSVNVPGINIPFLYFFILITFVCIFFGVVRRMLFTPSHRSRNVKVRGNSNADSA